MKQRVTLSDIQFWLVRLLIVVVVMSLEKVSGVPVITLVIGLWVFLNQTLLTRYIWFSILTLLIGTLYAVPFSLLLALLIASDLILGVLASTTKIRPALAISCTASLAAVVLCSILGWQFNLALLFQFFCVASVLVWMQKKGSGANHFSSQSSWLKWYEKQRT